MLQRDFLASFDYFVAARGRAPTESPGDRNDRVVQWAWAWPDLAPHVTRLLYDAEHHVRCKPDGVTWSVMNERSSEWTTVSSHFSPSPSAFEAAIVFHSVIRPEGPPLEVAFYRGDDTYGYVVQGVIRRLAPVPPDETTLSGDFPCDAGRAARVKRWILRQQTDASHAAAASTSSCVCLTCDFQFDNAAERTIHGSSSHSCGPPPPVRDELWDRITALQAAVNLVSFRVRKQHLLEDGNPLPGWGCPNIRHVRVGVDVVPRGDRRHLPQCPIPSLLSSRRTAIRCVRRPMSACLEDLLTVSDVIDLLGRGNSLGIQRHLASLHGIRSASFASVVAGPHIGVNDEYLHISLLMFTKRGSEQSRVYVHRSNPQDGRWDVLPCDAGEDREQREAKDKFDAQERELEQRERMEFASESSETEDPPSAENGRGALNSAVLRGVPSGARATSLREFLHSLLSNANVDATAFGPPEDVTSDLNSLLGQGDSPPPSSYSSDRHVTGEDNSLMTTRFRCETESVTDGLPGDVTPAASAEMTVVAQDSTSSSLSSEGPPVRPALTEPCRALIMLKIVAATWSTQRPKRTPTDWQRPEGGHPNTDVPYGRPRRPPTRAATAALVGHRGGAAGRSRLVGGSY